MKEIIGSTLSELILGPEQSFENAQAIPITRGPEPVTKCISLAAALKAGKLRVTEVSESGSVPELVVFNDADEPILLVDGEELVGAKQNRILNASILVPARSKLTVPVSCTEAGRWAYSSRQFEDSGVVAAHDIRKRKSRSVQDSLRERATYDSDQGEVWASIDDLHQRSGSFSSTSAMKDAFEDQKGRIDDVARAFPLVENQRGMFFIVGGRVLGLDVVSRSEVYADLHEKLVRSYAIDLSAHGRDTCADAEKLAYEFMGQITKAELTEHAAVGLGTDLRFSSDSVFGAALTAEDEVVHLNAFPTDRKEQEGPVSRLASYLARRRSRRG